eukprot:CAMPEP_0194028300 /NCGR_PEP_ID=MMETSP0009_2-20130614/2309_1 /TAXON_ID=210454 /ORGANISM="Grammatophora oceanica, Strain CCMP 410" /LENGTH=831 /DNA_ID=CAMNT_0038667649 /DNA_START=26 /DNA_END=2521 /DNA_ORIENTATION=+
MEAVHGRRGRDYHAPGRTSSLDSGDELMGKSGPRFPDAPTMRAGSDDRGNSSSYTKRTFLATGVATQLDPSTDSSTDAAPPPSRRNQASIHGTTKSAFVPFDEYDVERAAGDVGGDSGHPAVHPRAAAPVSNGMYRPKPRRAVPTMTSGNGHHPAVGDVVHQGGAAPISSGLDPPTQQQAVPTEMSPRQKTVGHADLAQVYTFNKMSSTTSNASSHRSYFQDEYPLREGPRGLYADIDDDDYDDDDDDGVYYYKFCGYWWSKLQLFLLVVLFIASLLAMGVIGYFAGQIELRDSNPMGATAPSPGGIYVSPSPSSQVVTATTARDGTPAPTPTYSLYLAPSRVVTVTTTTPAETRSPTPNPTSIAPKTSGETPAPTTSYQFYLSDETPEETNPDDESPTSSTTWITQAPSPAPTEEPTEEPTNEPTEEVTEEPTEQPTEQPTEEPTDLPTEEPTEEPTDSPTPPLEVYTVGTFYYPWHADDFHRDGGYVREVMGHEPTLGEYDDRDPEVIAQHLAWSRDANIRLWVTSWWGPGSREDTTTLNNILTHPELGDHQIALFYETTGLIKHANTNRENVNKVVTDTTKYICENYFSHPNYYTMDGGRPVLAMYLTRLVELWGGGLLEEIVLLMRSTAAEYGYNIYIMGDHAFKEPKRGNDIVGLKVLDAVFNYDVYGSIPNKIHAGEDGVETYQRHQRLWKDLAEQNNCDYIPVVAPGYNDRAVRMEKDHPPVSRRLTADSPHGSLFEALLRVMLPMTTEPTNRMILVNSFNEWHEDSQIEPAVGTDTTEPEEYTMGVDYIGYGTLYLEILRQMTVNYDEMVTAIYRVQSSDRDP